MATKAIWKFPVYLSTQTEARVPSEGKFLSAGEQDGKLMTWWLVDPEKPSVDRKFHIAGTGHAVTAPDENYVATVQMKNGLVWHLFLQPE